MISRVAWRRAAIVAALLAAVGVTAPAALGGEPCTGSPDAPAGWTLARCDAFEDNHAGWDVGAAHLDVGSVRRGVTHGAYGWDVDARKPLVVWASPVDRAAGDFYAAVDVRLTGGDPGQADIGLALEPEGEAPAWFLASLARGAAAYRAGELVTGRASTEVLHLAGWNRLALRREGGRLAFSVNGRAVAGLLAAGLDGPPVLLARVAAPGQYVLEFDNFELRLPPGAPRTETAFSPPDWPIAFHDTFVDNGNGWPIEEDFTRDWEAARVVQGTLAWQYRAVQEAFGLAPAPWPAGGDFYAAVDVKRYSGASEAEAGLAFRRSVPGGFHAFVFSEAGVCEARTRTADGWAPLIPPVLCGASEAGANRVAVWCRGARCAFALNGRAVGEADVGATEILPARGSVGLVLLAPQDAAGIVEFDNFELRLPAEKANP